MGIPEHPRVAVTGAASGLGRAFCTVLAQRGARIVASDLDLAGARATAALCPGAEVHPVACDVARLEDVEAMAAETDRLLGGVDLVINNAGVAVAGPVGEVSIENWQWVMSINLMGVIHGCHAFVPRLRKQRRGHVINVASAAGLISAPGMAPYNVTKAGVVALTETLFSELAGDSVGATVVCPTFFQTNIARDARVVDERQRGLVTKMLAAGKLSAEDVARAALDGAAAGELYVVPMRDGRWLWRTKRLAPQRFARTLTKLIRQQTQKLGASG
jgi:NAD(P)-dependent dehydrogenase (short-subunit alcohol dehydrogenase family)